MPKLKINDQEIEVAPGTSILQAAEQLGIEIPRFCYHDKLSVPANCRMCLVELEGAPKPVASCAMACGDNMVVRTASDKVKKGRKGVMEMMLINHPLDCPICDQGGECDLQDQAVAYGFDRSRYGENKRAVPDKNFGPLIKTSMNRCINCTRCVRFAEEIAGVDDLGQLNRGEDAEIGTFIEKAIGSEMSGNLVDVCPVGALTSKPYAFKARPWELKKTETVDVHDALGCNIRVDSRGNEVMRVLPRLHEGINEEWINDRTRHAVDGLKYKRLDRPYVRKNGKLVEASWDEAFGVVAAKMTAANKDRIAAFAGDLADVESMLALKDLMNGLGSRNYDCRADGTHYDVSERSGYVFNSGIAAIEQADAILLVGTNPRVEASLVNARIRKALQNNLSLHVGVVGEAADLTYSYHHAGNDLQSLASMVKEYAGKVKSERPMMIVGESIFKGAQGAAVQAFVRDAAEALGCVKEDWLGFNVLHTAASRVGGIEIGFVSDAPLNAKGMDVVYLLGVDNEETLSQITPNAFVIYQGHHGDAGAKRADVILPGAAYTEKSGLYVNMEGRVQMAKKAVDAPGLAREDWKILRALSEYAGQKLPYDDLMQLRARLVSEFPFFNALDELPAVQWASFGAKGDVSNAPLVSKVQDFYLTNVITKASPTMQECSRVFVHGEKFMEAAE
ncbi:MAG: NADH-quinone oxidoreductase subunit G [Micavibrio aeruginosavorus]|uniref:NADH-quinone oxidoreductase n=1 Tax=Micavibrio aeruginosavorus TaxID=349221 RepID=A0A2W4ZSY2_9BACT|nr:MAG: NADH-quinone oxidoreductase subunit G [Micavibrio aeruginosavorus]